MANKMLNINKLVDNMLKLVELRKNTHPDNPQIIKLLREGLSILQADEGGILYALLGTEYHANLATIFLRLSNKNKVENIKQATYHYKQAKQTLSLIPMSHQIFKDKMFLALTEFSYTLAQKHREIGSWQEAENLLEQARQTFTDHKDFKQLAKTLLEMGLLAHDYHRFEMADIYLKDALRLFRRLEHTEGIAATEAAMGNLILQTGRPTQAIELLETARQKYLGLNKENELATIDKLLQVAYNAQQNALQRQSDLEKHLVLEGVH